MKGFNHSNCPFCVRVAFDRLVYVHVVKRCRSSHIGHVVNLSSIVGHIRFEAGAYIEERNQLANFGKIGYTGLQSKVVLCRLFSSRIYCPNMIYRVVKKDRSLYYGNITDCMMYVGLTRKLS